MYGLSYAGAFLSAYATRFADHLRAVVIDAGVPTTDPRHSWTWGVDVPPREADVVELDCDRAPACADAQPRAGSALARIAAAVRRHKVTGTVAISGLGTRKVTVDEIDVVGMAFDLLNQGELAAVAQALDRGDKKPLLRLAGEARLFPFEPGDPVFDSAGDNAAAFCNDNDFVWNRTDPIPVRRAKYKDALEEMGWSAFAPFSRHAWTAAWLTDYCLMWPAPDRFTPSVPRGATVTGLPVLILSGDLDTNVPTRTSEELLRVFPDATFVDVAGAAHPAAG
jgi:pimeloyl-ACP methyl ester carboxylesterase